MDKKQLQEIILQQYDSLFSLYSDVKRTEIHDLLIQYIVCYKDLLMMDI